jgi:hypothetical protein
MAKPKYIESGNLSDPRLLGLDTWSNPNILGLAACQTRLFGSTHSQTQVRWVWPLCFKFILFYFILFLKRLTTYFQGDNA